MMGGYQVFSNNLLNMPSGGGACAHYRIIQPLATMENLGLPIQAILDNSELPLNGMQRDALFLESDFVLSYQQLSDRVSKLMNDSKGFKVMKNAQGQPHWPPTYIVDADDDIFNVMPLNISYANLGTKSWSDPLGEGRLCDDGDEISFAHPIEFAAPDIEPVLNDRYPNPLPGARGDIGEDRFTFGGDGRWHPTVALWRDGVNVNFATNRKKMEAWRGVLHAANLITCTTPRLAAALRRELGDGVDIFVTPNAVDFAGYPKIDLAEHKNVRILWEGSMCHHEGLWPLNDALKRVGEKYPEVEWVFFGAPYRWAMGNLPVGKTSLVPWVHYEAYKLRLSTFGHDIALAPLAPSIFNQSRSAIRWYENSAIWKPAAVLAQKTAAFEDEIQDGETGLLFETPEEFETKLCGLIEDTKLRQTLAGNAKDWIRTHREAGKVSTDLFMEWVRVREGHKRTVPLGDSMTDAIT